MYIIVLIILIRRFRMYPRQAEALLVIIGPEIAPRKGKIQNVDWPNDANACRKIGIDFFKLSKGPAGELPGF